MRIKSIELKNFLSYKDVELNLVDNINENSTLFNITGINLDDENDNNSSNGSGKSTVASESIFYNIYGKGLRGSKGKLKLNDMIRYNATEMSNFVKYFIQDNDEVSELAITRTKTNKNGNGSSTTKIELNGQEKSKRTKSLSDKDIKLFMDLTPSAFSQSIIYYTENDNLFKMNYSQRLEFFKEMIDLSILDDYYDKAKSFRVDNEKELQKLYLIKKNTEDIINIVEENKSDYIKYIQNNIAELQAKLDKANSVEIVSCSKYEEILKELNDMLNNENTEYANNLSQLKICGASKDKIEKEIDRLEKLAGGECPTCKQYVSGRFISAVVEEYEDELNDYRNKINEATEKQTDIEKNIKEIKLKIEKIKDKINEINTQNRLREREISTIKSEIDRAKRDLSLAESENSKEKIDKNKYQVKLNGIENAIKQREEWKETIEYWYNIFSPKSVLRSSILKKYITILSDFFEYYLSRLYSSDLQVSLTIDNDGNIDYILSCNGSDTNYWCLSSGEKKRLNLALFFGLRAFIQKVTAHTPQYIILDEVFDSLDTNGINGVMEVLFEIMSEEKTDVFIVSHIPFDISNKPENINVKTIIVTKKDGISTAKIREESI